MVFNIEECKSYVYEISDTYRIDVICIGSIFDHICSRNMKIKKNICNNVTDIILSIMTPIIIIHINKDIYSTIMKNAVLQEIRL